uniref:Glucose dehydrogenase [FAD, quinone] n=1 Tax=Cacopsylla melanoneura TaxID=428564 RepID=A0A8D8Z3B6_9HEMI
MKRQFHNASSTKHKPTSFPMLSHKLSVKNPSKSTKWLISLVMLILLHLVSSSNAALSLREFLLDHLRVHSLPFREDSRHGNKPMLKEYDFIVVGAGPAGCVVTNRLTENPDWNILLLEAGDEESVITDIPEIAHYLQFSRYNWNFSTEFQPGACRGLNNERCPWPSGRAVGGGSVINNNIYTRGNPNDFDRWLEAGNEGWGYADVLPYFKKSEDIDVPELKRSEFHGVGGYLNVDYSPFKSKLLDAFLESAPEVGLNLTDYNSPDGNVGFSRIQATIQFGRRHSASQAFLVPIADRQNFHVMKKAHVTKILIDRNTKRAYGVEFTKNRKKRVVYAKKEVILSSGAFFSPHLLLLSGIGPRDQLEKFNIPVVADLQVGENLQEHPAFASLAFTVNRKVGLISDRIYSNLAKEVFKSFTNQGWTTSLGCEGLGYVRTKYNNYPPGVPDIEYIFVPAGLASEEEKGLSLLRKTMGIPDGTFNEIFRGIKNKDAWSIWPMLMYPESRGYVRLKSADPFVYPAVQSNFFQDPLDLLRIVEGIKMVIELSQTKAFQKYKSKLSTRILPACKKFDYGSDEYWGCCVRQLTMQMHHQCGTCKMGPRGDRTAVVDPRLRVQGGIRGLRVIDSSIMPTITGGHTVAPSYMIGEKGADLVKEDWLQNQSFDLVDNKFGPGNQIVTNSKPSSQSSISDLDFTNAAASSNFDLRSVKPSSSQTVNRRGVFKPFGFAQNNGFTGSYFDSAPNGFSTNNQNKSPFNPFVQFYGRSW